VVQFLGSIIGPEDFENNQRAIVFFALGFAAAKNTQLVCLILFDATQPESGIGGTKSFISLCEQLQIYYEWLNMVKIRNNLQQDRSI
jgi:hypothetical protein